MLIPKDAEDSFDYDSLCRLAVDLSQGGLVGISIRYFAEDELLLYIAERSSQLKHLELASCYDMSDKAMALVAAKIPLLEELAFSDCKAYWKTVEVFGRCCPLLKTFKLNVSGFSRSLCMREDEEALAIAKKMPGLVHLHLFGNQLTNDGLEAIMDACPRLESLDLRQCFHLNLRGELGKRCAERIKNNLRLPDDPIEYSDEDEYEDGSLNYDDDYDDFSDEDLGSDEFFPGI